jgi:nucleoside-diphosphate-sugar epimerase
MSDERFLVTGAGGCVGAWTVRTLLDQGCEVVALDLSTDDRRLRLLASEEELAGVRFVRADIADAEAVERTVARERITNIVHLAALQIPFARADPVRGAQVNVVGTVNVFQAALAHREQVRGLAYASSVAVFGPHELYPGGVAVDDSPLSPRTLYGVWKQANEWTAAVYAREHGLGSVGLRPCVVYGVGRDQGLTSGPTLAMLAAAFGRGYHIEFGGTSVYQLASDAAELFVAAARVGGEGAEVLNMSGSTVAMPEVVAAIEEAAPDVAGAVDFDDIPLPFPSALDASGMERLLGPSRMTPFTEGVRRTVDAFRELLGRGLVAPEDVT